MPIYHVPHVALMTSAVFRTIGDRTTLRILVTRRVADLTLYSPPPPPFLGTQTVHLGMPVRLIGRRSITSRLCVGFWRL